MFRTTKRSSSGRRVPAVLWNFFMRPYKQPGRCQDVSTYYYEGALKSSRLKKEKKNEFIISKLFLFFIVISLKTNTVILSILQRYYLVPVVVLHKICKMPLYSCNRLLIRRKTLTSEEEFELWEETEVRGSQIYGIGWMFQQFIVQIP
jgi:hypothetical protein